MRQMNKKGIIIAVIIVLVIILGSLLLYGYFSRSSDNANEPTAQSKSLELRSRAELMETIVSSKPSFKDKDGKLTIRIVDTPERLENNWYIVRIQPATYDYDTAKLLLYDDGDNLKLILGPGTNFTDDVLDGVQPSIPNIVRSEINR